MNAKTVKIILAVVLLVVAALLIFRFVSGGSPSTAPVGGAESTNEIAPVGGAPE